MRHERAGGIRIAGRGIQPFGDHPRPQRPGYIIGVAFHIADHPVGQHGHAAVRSDQHQDHGGQFDRPLGARFDPRLGQKFGENVQLVAADRVGDQHLIAEIFGHNHRLGGERVSGRGDEGRGIIKQRVKRDASQRLWVRRDHKVNLLAQQGRKAVKREASADVHIHLRPGMAEQFQHHKQPVKAGVALDGDVQAAGFARLQRAEFFLQCCYFGQDAFGHPQHPGASRRQAHRLGPAHEQLHPDLIFKACDLMRQGGLRGVQDLGSPCQTPSLLDSP